MSTPAERSRAYRDRKRGGPPRKLLPHGTIAAYRRHERAGEEPCTRCRKAHARYQADLYARRRSSDGSDGSS